jgi:exonuclease V
VHQVGGGGLRDGLGVSSIDIQLTATQNLAPGIDTPPLQPQTPTLDSTNNSIDANADTNKSPYDRFRAARKGLSVTDLVSNVWCEQQFEYTLARGYKRATPQMQKGTKLHRKLEEQVHSVVEVDVSTSEDRWGLRLWNLYQGFRGLLDGGIARELPVFGFLNNGVYVTGIVDEVSFVDPRNTADILRANTNGRSLEDEGSDEGGGTRRRGRCKKMKQLVVSGPDAFPVPPKGRRVAYLSDTKTRGIRSVPTASQQRATELQLMIYHRLLSQLFTGLLSFTLVLEHECLDGSARFSDGFIAQISKLIFDDENGLTLEDLLENNSLCGLWGLIQKQMEITIDAVGDTMGVSYRYQKDGEFFAFHFFENNKDVLDRHLQDTMEWWNGKRSTVGVDIEEAWKCIFSLQHYFSPGN